MKPTLDPKLVPLVLFAGHRLVGCGSIDAAAGKESSVHLEWANARQKQLSPASLQYYSHFSGSQLRHERNIWALTAVTRVGSPFCSCWNGLTMPKSYAHWLWYGADTVLEHIRCGPSDIAGKRRKANNKKANKSASRVENEWPCYQTTNNLRFSVWISWVPTKTNHFSNGFWLC